KRHFKRRLIQTALLDQLSEVMRPGAVLSLATDSANYAEWMLEHLEAHPNFVNLAGEGQFAPEPAGWITTNFQSKGERAGRLIRHFAYAVKGSDALSNVGACSFE
ncbi:MAG: tRNA (guanosine(46)-N7)-methyltransferase TrmB, partial [Magnetococcales bacterium]|nr:tRNA (guanosine(46)-N7)-methyltransferase TrmB [Magnetococcales bacterium]